MGAQLAARRMLGACLEGEGGSRLRARGLGWLHENEGAARGRQHRRQEAEGLCIRLTDQMDRLGGGVWKRYKSLVKQTSGYNRSQKRSPKGRRAAAAINQCSFCKRTPKLGSSTHSWQPNGVATSCGAVAASWQPFHSPETGHGRPIAPGC